MPENRKLTLFNCQACARQSSRYFESHSSYPFKKSIRIRSTKRRITLPWSEHRHSVGRAMYGPGWQFQSIPARFPTPLSEKAGLVPQGPFVLYVCPLSYYSHLWESLLRRKSKRGRKLCACERVVPCSLVCSNEQLDVDQVSPRRNIMQLWKIMVARTV